jgi:PAS domain S-box-containing protein
MQVLVDASPMAIGFSRDGVMLDANAAYVRLFGYASVDEIRGRSILEQIAPSHRGLIGDMVSQRARGEPLPTRYETRGLRRDGSEFPFDITTTRVVVADGPLTIAFLSDLSERSEALAALLASEERFRTLSGAAFEGVFLHADGKILLANDAGAAMYGYDAASMVGMSLMDLTDPDSRALVAEQVRAGATAPYEGLARRRDGSTFVAEVHGRTLRHQGRNARVTILRDVTDRKRAEAEQRALAERMQHAQKLESLGVLAGGVAHDFNNILTVIMNGAALAKREWKSGAAADAHLDTIALAAERAADLCRQMLAYAGKAAFSRERVALSALVGEMSSMLEVSIAKKATLARDLADGLPPLLGDATQLRQIVMNLVLNASEAVGDAGGTVRVTTAAGHFEQAAFARSIAGVEPPAGDYVYVEVEDDGIGMDAATVTQMFDPFFTTKFVGRGLGMAAVLGIVRSHGGAIDVDSTPGKGTRIRVYFPAAAETPRPAQRARPDVRGEGVVLVVDDESAIRRTAELLLRAHGFEVLSAADGVEAIEVFRRESARIDVVLLDLTMPRLGGAETLVELRRIARDVPVVLTSGYGAPSASMAEAADATLAKPYSADELLQALADVKRRRRG